jgi:hypothetical protein
MSTPRHSQRLRQRIDQVRPELSATVSELMMHARFRELYLEWLIVVHQMIRATVPLMRTALRRCQELQDRDAVAAAMVPYLDQHIKEELYHDDWLLEDLEFLGVPRAEVQRRIPSSAVASLIGGHYYWIEHHHPVAELGQIAVMEGYPPSAEMIELLAARTGYERPAFRTLEKHGHLDAHHRDDFDAALDRMPLSEEHHAILAVSAEHTVHRAAQAYREILERDAAADLRDLGPERIPLRQPGLTARRVSATAHRVEDQHRAAVYEVGESDYFLLTQCDGRRSREAVCQAFAAHFDTPLTEAELDEFLQVAQAAQLIGTDGPRRAESNHEQARSS